MSMTCQACPHDVKSHPKSGSGHRPCLYCSCENFVGLKTGD
ncbi:hypothetical protein [Nitrosopumilus sp. b2]|nr:hypothetical protein [Nitrosopumilus sp. b2]